MQDQYRKDRLLVMGLLVVIAVVVQAGLYVLHVRPEAMAWQGREQAKQAANPDYKPERSVW